MCLCICIYKILVCNFCLSVWHLIGTCSSTLSRGKSIFIRFLAYSRVFPMFSCVISDELTFITVFSGTLYSLSLSLLILLANCLRHFALKLLPPSLSLSVFGIPNSPCIGQPFPVSRSQFQFSRIELPVLFSSFSHFSTFVARARNFKLV